MPADHINIQHPDSRGIYSREYEDRLRIEKLEIELKQLRMWYDEVANDLKAIFTRIDRGDPAELHYPDGRVLVVTGVEKDQS